jgi:polyribonucleotide nucleotidyltransferase
MKALIDRPEGMPEERFEPRGDRPPRRDREDRPRRERSDREDRPRRDAVSSDGPVATVPVEAPDHGAAEPTKLPE